MVLAVRLRPLQALLVLVLPCLLLGTSSEGGGLVSSGSNAGHSNNRHEVLQGRLRRSSARRGQLMADVGSAALLQRLRSRREQRTLGCRGSKLKFWITVKQKCRKAYGGKSKWDKSRLNGHCKTAWDLCSTASYAVCCSQPVGAKDLGSYCKGMDATHGNPDAACEVAPAMQGMQGILTNIEGALGKAEDGPENANIESVAAPSAAPSTPPPVAVSPAPRFEVAHTGGDEAEEEKEDAEEEKGRGEQGREAEENDDDEKEHRPKLPRLPPIAPAVVRGLPMAMTVGNCQAVKGLLKKAKSKFSEIRNWVAARDPELADYGKNPHEQESAFAFFTEVIEFKTGVMDRTDPDLGWGMKDVLVMGRKLKDISKQKLCEEAPFADDDTDLDGDVDDEDDQAQEEDEEDDVPDVIFNEPAVAALFKWLGEMGEAVQKFQKDVHPKGLKWWRYRYQYTVLESFILSAYSLLLYLVMWGIHALPFVKTYKFYKTGILPRLYRYAHIYFLFHAASLALIIWAVWFLAIGSNFYDWVKTFTDFLVARLWGEDPNLKMPILGASYYQLAMAVLCQLLMTFIIYALAVCMIIRNYVKALADWRNVVGADPQDDFGRVKPSRQNLELYNELYQTMVQRLEENENYQRIFRDNRIKMKDVSTMGQDAPHQFHLHLYLTDALGRSIEYLVEVSLLTHTVVSVFGIIIAMLALHYHVMFMWLAVPILLSGLAIFVFGYVAARSIQWADKNNIAPSRVEAMMSLHGFVRTVQILLYLVFYSFSRLLLSHDIWAHYFPVYVAAWVLLTIVLLAMFFFGGEVMKELCCSMLLPARMPPETFARFVGEVAMWQSLSSCHECGTIHLKPEVNPSNEWASVGSTTPRMWSFRGC